MTSSDENGGGGPTTPGAPSDDRSEDADSLPDTGESTAADSTDDRPLVYGLGTAVGAFVVLGVGLVLTSFFVAQFGGTTEAFGATFLGSGSSLGFAVLLSPVLAVLLGVVLGRAHATVVDAAAATAVGFVSMYLVTAVVTGSLYSPAAGPGLGSLAGFAVGVALAGGLAAAVADRDLAVSAGNVAVGRPAVFGVAVVATYAVGVAAAAVLAGALTGPPSDVEAARRLFSAPPTRTALSFGLLFLPVVGLLAGYLGTPAHVAEQAAAASGAVAGAGGAVVALVVFYAAAVATGPSGAFPVGWLVGLAVGTGLTGAGAAVVAARE